MPALSEEAREYDRQVAQKRRIDALRAQMDYDKSVLELDKLRREDPEYQYNQSALLAQRVEDITRQLKGIGASDEIDRNQMARIANASTPLPDDQPGPVLPMDLAMQQTSAIQQRMDERSRNQAGLRAQLETTRRQLGGFTGTVNLPEGMGTAPAGQYATVYEQRAAEMVPLVVKAQQDIAQTADPQERAAKEGVYSQLKAVADTITRKQAADALKIPGLEGTAVSEKNANEMRAQVADFAASSQNIDQLIQLSLEGRNYMNLQKAEAIRSALQGQLRTVINGPGPQSDQDAALIREIISNPVNPLNYGAREKLTTLKGAIARKIVSSASVYGYRVNSLRDLVKMGGVPFDFEAFTTADPNYPNEAKARAAGFRDGDKIKIRGVEGTLKPDRAP
jgi:hypothetical protein